MGRIKEYRISLLVICSVLMVMTTMIGCGWLGLTEPTDTGINLEVSGDDNVINIDNNENEGDGELNNDECGNCGDLTNVICYSIPSGTERECGGCIIGHTCTINEPCSTCGDDDDEE